ncbi:putative leader peptide [Streptomyces sp. NPDC001985]
MNASEGLTRRRHIDLGRIAGAFCPYAVRPRAI